MIDRRATELNRMWIKFKCRNIAVISLYNCPLNNFSWFMHPRSIKEGIGTCRKETSWAGFSIPLRISETTNITRIINYINIVKEKSFKRGQNANLNILKKLSFLGSWILFDGFTPKNLLLSNLPRKGILSIMEGLGLPCL